MKPCRIVDYTFGKNPLNLGTDPTQNGRMSVILDIRYNALNRGYMWNKIILK